jgi:D-glycero-alpha-D-manno-heptose-7-phosphate kinase
MVISMAIDKHIYLTAHPMFDSEEILLKYSAMERVSHPSQVRHNIFRVMLEKYDVTGIDIGVSSDIPSGTGLGSSSAFAVGLSKLLNTYLDRQVGKEEIASEACEVEINSLNQLIGKQDQYASAYGGFNRFSFLPNGSVHINPIEIDANTLNNLNESLLLVRVGYNRSAGAILAKQDKIRRSGESADKALDRLLRLTQSVQNEVFSNLDDLGELVTQSWRYKKESNPFATNVEIDELINFGLSKGALGAKLLGAGGAGFVLFVVPPEFKDRFIAYMENRKVLDVKIDFEGSQLIHDSRVG